MTPRQVGLHIGRSPTIVYDLVKDMGGVFRAEEIESGFRLSVEEREEIFRCLTRGDSLRQIANASKVGVRYLEYIEQDRFAYLPAPVYLRGFLQEYARMVGLDPRRVTESYLSQMGRRA